MTTQSATASPDENASTTEAAEPSGSASTSRTIVPQFALEAADAKIATWSTAIVDAANTIERLLSSESLPVPDGVRDLATSTTEKLRGFGTKAGEQDAKELVAGLQRTAAAHPAASIGVGAAIGAALAAVLVRMGAPAATDPDGTDQSNTGSTSTKKSAGRSSALASNVSPKPSSAKS